MPISLDSSQQRKDSQDSYELRLMSVEQSQILARLFRNRPSRLTMTHTARHPRLIDTAQYLRWSPQLRCDRLTIVPEIIWFKTLYL